MMAKDGQIIKFDSGSGWAVEKLTFMPQYGISVEALFTGKKGDSMYLELRGIQSPEELLNMLMGFDDFRVLTRETESPNPAGQRFLFRCFIDDDIFETIIDEYEAYKTTTTEQGGDGDAEEAV